MRRIAPRFLFAAATILAFGPAGADPSPSPPAAPGASTAPVPPQPSVTPVAPSPSAPAAFAIVAVDSARREWGVAAVSRWIAVGARSVEARAGSGAWLALELPDRRLAALLLDRMQAGGGARVALDSVLARDARRNERQIALVDRAGGTAAFTGFRCPPWAGERFGPGYVCQGVGLRDGQALLAMGRAFEGAKGSLAERLLTAVASAEFVAPVREKVESAAILVAREGGGPDGWSDRLVDLRVDMSQDAVQELTNVYAAHAATFLPAAYARFGDDAKRRGDSISAEREYARAEAGFRAAVSKHPQDSDALNELAWFLATHDRDLAGAVQLAKTAVSRRPRDSILYDTLAEAEYRSGSLLRAIEAMERAVRYSGGDGRYAERLERWERERSALERKGAAKP